MQTSSFTLNDSDVGKIVSLDVVQMYLMSILGVTGNTRIGLETSFYP